MGADSVNENQCPSCDTTQVVHRWRCNMATLKWIDTYKCLRCGEKWVVEGTPEFVDRTWVHR